MERVNFGPRTVSTARSTFLRENLPIVPHSMSRTPFPSILARADLFLQHLVTSSPKITEESYIMDAKTRALYLADDPPTVVRLEIAAHFNVLNAKQKRYAHHLSRWEKIPVLENV